ncbi:MAG: dTDP-3-amino-3,6-dideoxy-alpha-D-glucopyranose N,N-dimethyltransferase [Myxococcota bacterium]|nr:dTDP-3-amino-3,6-dideoxy-alpha-D-glucopyranose N,N-dimethyltransferase [Myxococcota bacterium]
MKIFYEELAPWWPLLSPVEDYAAEAAEFIRIIEEKFPAARTMLELGSGGGHNAFYLKRRFAMTLTDLSKEMLRVSGRINPECRHMEGDMRTLDLGGTFDVVFAHDAIDYMTTETDLRAVMAAARRHLEPGGLAMFVPDHVKERYSPETSCGGTDGEGRRALRCLEWTMAPDPGETAGVTHYCFLVREADGSTRFLHESHPFGLFPRETWVRLLEQTGFSVETVEERTLEERTPRLIFLGRKI